MTACFADTAYFLALVTPNDIAHEAAVALATTIDRPFLTTSAIVTELGSHLAKPQNRPVFLGLLDDLQQNPLFRLIHVDPQLFEQGLTLFREPTDKSWSLVDCISFVLMTTHGVNEVLTTDRHYQQAGFTVLLPIVR